MYPFLTPTSALYPTMPDPSSIKPRRMIMSYSGCSGWAATALANPPTVKLASTINETTRTDAHERDSGTCRCITLLLSCAVSAPTPDCRRRVFPPYHDTIGALLFI